MRFASPRRRRPVENIVPMINVVFLLLIFFLMTARIGPSDPIEVDPPTARAEDAVRDGDLVLHVSASGELALGEVRGGDVWAALDGAGALTLRADAVLDAVRLAQILSRLAEIGITDVFLAVLQP